MTFVTETLSKVGNYNTIMPERLYSKDDFPLNCPLNDCGECIEEPNHEVVYGPSSSIRALVPPEEHVLVCPNCERIFGGVKDSTVIS